MLLPVFSPRHYRFPSTHENKSNYVVCKFSVQTVLGKLEMVNVKFTGIEIHSKLCASGMRYKVLNGMFQSFMGISFLVLW